LTFFSSTIRMPPLSMSSCTASPGVGSIFDNQAGLCELKGLRSARFYANKDGCLGPNFHLLGETGVLPLWTGGRLDV
jgi:hypothetical protein